MKHILSILFISLLSINAQAQYTMIGVIEFERKINMHSTMEAQMKDMEAESSSNSGMRGGSGFMAQMINRIPKYNTSYHNLHFTTTKTAYTKGRTVVDNNKMRMPFAQAPDEEGVVVTNFVDSTVKTSRNVFQEQFQFDSKIRQMQWKIMDEVRVIAGYTCRKAVGTLFDSVVVVAFYTDDIMVSGGPERFAGLPGMILQVTIPRMYTTWMATKIEIKQPTDQELAPTIKGKTIKEEEIINKTLSTFKQYSTSLAHRSIWWTLI
jgi:GLPGLI family protein